MAGDFNFECNATQQGYKLFNNLCSTYNLKCMDNKMVAWGYIHTALKLLVTSHWSITCLLALAPTLGASIAHLSRTEVPWVGSTSGATVANVSNIDVFEMGTNIVLLSWNSLRELPHSTNVLQDRGCWLFLPARAWDIILELGRERARAKKSSSLHSVCLGFLHWNETGSDLLVSEDEL